MTAPKIKWISAASLVDYQSAIDFMNQRVIQIQNHEQPECIWLLEHPSLYTMGTSATLNDIRSPLPYPAYRTGRGGQITYHGPGQLIGYVMLDLNIRGRDVKKFMRNLESWLILTLKDFGLIAKPHPERIGLWIEKPEGRDEKIAAFGIRIQKWITSHGFALNINPDMSAYKLITPCGVSDHGITSCYQESVQVTRQQIEKQLKLNFDNIFQVLDNNY